MPRISREKVYTSATPINSIRSRRCFRFLGSHVISPWVYEILCMILSVLLMMAMAILLGVYDRRPVSDWQGSVSLNFIISLLGTACKAALTFSVAAGLSQSKWIWFTSQERPLLDFKRFDDASRGALGSVQLLWVTKIR